MEFATNSSLISSDITKFYSLTFSTVVSLVTLFIGHCLNHMNLF